MSFIIRPFEAGEAALYRDIRLEALRLHPEAFGAAYEQELEQKLDWFEARVTSNVIFGGFQDQDVFGTAGFMPETGRKRVHKAHLWGMYVRAAARGTGLAKGLVQAVLGYAQERVELIQLSVVSTNATARRLYASHGFEPYGIEEHSLKLGDAYFDEVLMVKMLT